MKKLIILLFMSSSSILFADTIFDNMDEETTVSTGIYKLSSQEKKQLITWLNDSREKTRDQIKQEVIEEVSAEAIKKDKKRFMGFRREESQREEIQTTYIGEFKGWRGKQIFKLANGQIWRQAENSTFYIPKKMNPEITIKPKSMGTWQLYVKGFGRGVKVKRIK